MSRSLFLGPRALAALERIGDIMLPAGDGFPAFSHTGSLRYVDDLLTYLAPGDRRSLAVLLSLLSLLPDWGLRGFLRLLGLQARLPAGPGAPLRLIELGLKGLVMNLYYSNKTAPDFAGARPFDVIGFSLTRSRDRS